MGRDEAREHVEAGSEAPEDAEVLEQISELFEEVSGTGTEEPIEGSQPEEDESEKSVEPGEQEAQEEPTEDDTPQETQPTEPQAQPVVTIDGTRYTPQELAEALIQNPDLFRAVATRAEQAPHWQRRFEELRAALGGPTPKAEAGGGELTPDQIAERERAAYAALKQRGAEVLQAASAAGAVEEEFAEFYPETARLLAGTLAEHQRQIAAIGQILGGLAHQNQVEWAQRVVQEADRVLAGLADDAGEAREAFEGLRDPSERQAFLTWLDEMARRQGTELPLSVLEDRDYLRRQYVAYHGDALARQVSEAKKRNKDEERAAKRAAPRRSAVTPRRPKTREELGFEDLFQ